MVGSMSVEAWIGIGTALITLAGAVIKLVTTILQSRRQPPPEPAIGGGPGPAVSDDRLPEPPPKDPLLPGRASFINRKREMSDLISRVRAGDDTLLTIEGDRWVGKSATATELVHSLRSGQADGSFDPRERRFVWFDAHGECPTLADICGRLSLATDDQSLAAAAEAHKREELRVHLAGNRTVLVLDNLSLGDDQPSRILIDLLEDLPDGSLVIAAVNRPGALVAPRVPLGELSAADVKRLIDDRARRLNLDGVEQFNEEFAKRLHDLIGGNPGVIEWFLRGYHSTSEPLEDRIAGLEKGGELSEVFAPAWQALSEDCRSTLQACAYLRGEATAQQIAIACDRPEQAMRAAADELRHERLLTSVRGRNRPTVYTCARAFRLFIASETPESRRALFTQRLADHYIRHFTESPEDADYGVSEVGAWRVVRDELGVAGDDTRIQALFRSVLDILFTLGQYDELIDAAERSFESAESAENFAGAALAGAMKAGTQAIRGEVVEAGESLALAGVAAEASGQAGPISRVQRCQGFVQYRSRRPRQALAAIEGTEDLSRQGEEPINLVDTLDLRTAANWYLRRFDACEAAARASLEASSQMGWERAGAYPLRYLAELALQRRQPPQARKLIEEAHEITVRFRDKRQRARVELTRARLCLLEGELDRGRTAAAEAVAETTRLGLPPEREEALAVAAAIDRARRSWLWRRFYSLRRPTRLSTAPVGGD
jgi:hypothetical protein